MARLLMTIIFVGTIQGQMADTGTLKVCEVLSNRNSYMGQRIRIRGTLIESDEGSYLTDEGCPQLVTDGYAWPTPSLIALKYQERPTSQDVKQSRSTITKELADSEILKIVKNGAKIHVTVIGRLETRPHFEMVLRGDGKMLPNGYGHLNACPAQIVYQEIRDMEIVPIKPTPAPGSPPRR